MSPQHSFHHCPLRSSSLLIVSQAKQTIISATDEVFDLLGYTPSQLIGHNLAILDLQKSHPNRVLARHESQGQVPLEVCLHPDPLDAAAGLDYWLLRPAYTPHTLLSPSLSIPQIPTPTQSSSPITIVRLNNYGTIELVHPSAALKQTVSDLVDRPLLSFLHPSDVKTVCESLRPTYKQTYHTFQIRWRSHDGTYEWTALTVMNAPRRLSCAAVDDPLSRPICILRPIRSDTSCAAAASTNTFLWFLSMFHGARSTVDIWTESMESVLEAMKLALHHANGYMVEFFAHLLTSVADLVMDYAQPGNGREDDAYSAVYVEQENKATETIRLRQRLDRLSRRLALIQQMRKWAGSSPVVQRSLETLGVTNVFDYLEESVRKTS
ncbi:hypothetical protein DFQ28_003073 [Apophysomyces sp. BC1034]|nr:hypothetical protein DFQ30_001978 [Apophysomyces sp. BC1015]KAG0179281.1 hypothetical protein DFQ29_002283 [Apophysomyces sp. BC1021]KAG0189711.1 hypothetical protein DFQ28_003073 [Apophysomyces sp. BC1034]